MSQEQKQAPKRPDEPAAEAGQKKKKKRDKLDFSALMDGLEVEVQQVKKTGQTGGE
jgi:hypothetical protein